MALSSVVVGTDFSRGAQRAVQRASALAHAHEARLTVVHAAARRSRAPERELDAEVRALRSDGLHAASVVSNDLPVRALVSTATRVGAGLLVVGGSGRPIVDELLGSTAERLIARSPCPVLVARAPVAPYTRVLVAVGIDRRAAGAVRFVRELAPGAQVDLLHVYASPFEATLFRAGVEHSALADHRRAFRRETRAVVGGALAGADVQADRVLLQHGDAREEIARRTRSGRYDAVAVIGSGSRIARWLFGSVTRAVLRGAEVDTLLL